MNGRAPFCQNSPSHCPVWLPGRLTRYDFGLALWYLTAASANSSHVLIGVSMPGLVEQVLAVDEAERGGVPGTP